MKKFLFLAMAVIAALSSCTSDDIVANENENQNVNAPVFSATIEGNAASRTVLDGNKVNWESGDEVKMMFFNSSYSVMSLPVYKATPSTSDASTATLSIKDGETYNEAADNLILAVYPASIVNDKMEYIFPATQKYKGDGKIGFAPMFFLNLSASVPQTLNFSNACALLAITVPYTEMTSVRSITVSSDLQMNGKMGLDAGGYFYFDSPSNPGSGENQVTLDCYSLNNANVAIPEGGSKTFYVSIVPRDKVKNVPYLKYLQIDVTDGTTTKTMRTKTFEGTEASGIEIVRNQIYPIAFADNQTPAATTGTAKATINGSEVDVDWVQLWAGGPKFATQNVASAMTWTDAAKTGADFVWGANWKCPSKTEMDLLNSAKVKYELCFENGDYVYKFTGVEEGYTSNSISLPVEYVYEDDFIEREDASAYYWTSSGNNTMGDILRLYYDILSEEYSDFWTATGKGNKYSVRPVLSK